MRISDWSSDVCSSDLGYSPDWIERQLAHEEPHPVRRTYNHAAYLKDRAIMMQQWATFLDQWKTGATNVTPIRDRKSVGSGKSVSVRVDLCGRRILKKKKETIPKRPKQVK